MIEISFSAWWLLAAPIALFLLSAPLNLLAFGALLFIGKLLPNGTLRRYLINRAGSDDQHANSFFGGSRDQTLSSRMGLRLEKGPTGCRVCYGLSWLVCKLLHVIDRDHCQKYAAVDRGEERQGVWYRG